MDLNSFTVNSNIQKHFVGWQCRVREYALRNNEGRPTLGICPRVLSKDGSELSQSIILLLIPKKKTDSIQQFRFIAKKTNDPNERYKKAIQILSSTFFQNIDDFDGELTGLFLKNSLTASKIKKHKSCILDFYYQNQSFKISSRVEELSKKDSVYQFTFWHNFLFNPNLSPESRVLTFRPDWSHSIANPKLK
tara:strand:+ start:962 stop:1537 length:576 start_codon:yes stop_codon:yes gene_type:complete